MTIFFVKKWLDGEPINVYCHFLISIDLKLQIWYLYHYWNLITFDVLFSEYKQIIKE